nr:EOG090X0EPT [Leptodora kindtii]
MNQDYFYGQCNNEERLTLAGVPCLADFVNHQQSYPLQQVQQSCFPTALAPLNGQTFCVTQNGVAYLAVAANSSQWYQAIETPQGLQLFQVVTNSAVPNVQCLNLQQQMQYPQCQVKTEEFSKMSGDLTQEWGVKSHNSRTNVSVGNNEHKLIQDSSVVTQFQKEEREEESCANENEMCTEKYEYADYNEKAGEIQAVNPINALSSLTSSIIPVDTQRIVRHVVGNPADFMHSLVGNGAQLSLNNVGQQQQAVIMSVPEQHPMVPNGQSIQVLVPTSQGDIMNETISELKNDSAVDPCSGFTYSVVSNVNFSVAPETLRSDNLPADNTANSFSSASTVDSQKTSCSQPSPELPDSTQTADDMSQPTIKQLEQQATMNNERAGNKQTTCSIVDGIDLEEIREFARTFKMRRLALGLTQNQVGLALCDTQGPAYSQSAICSAMKIRPVLEQWLNETEKIHQRKGQASLDVEYAAGLYNVKKTQRKRRTFFNSEALEILMERFKKNPHPTNLLNSFKLCARRTNETSSLSPGPDGLAEYLSENPDFLVIGFVGLQWSGKSTVSSHLAASNCSEFVKQSVFNISTTNFQMKGETATSGIDAYICNDRTIWLDCQPLLSAAVIERELASAYSKDVYKESSLKFETSCIGTQVEVQSLQILSFLYCICHVLVVVQDSLADPNLIRLLQTAEMLKPNMSSDESSHDHMPHLVILYNRAQPSDLIPDMLGKAYKFHKQAFSKSRLGISSSLTKGHPLLATHDHDINYVPLLDFVVTDSLWSKILVDSKDSYLQSWFRSTFFSGVKSVKKKALHSTFNVLIRKPSLGSRRICRRLRAGSFLAISAARSSLSGFVPVPYVQCLLFK